jgi:uncharacterized pyridoxal phosphate-containing UPF0001 family protein
VAAARDEVRGLSTARVAENLDRVRDRIAAAGGDPGRVEVCAAIKYVPVDELPVLAEAGVTLVGENRAQDLIAAQDRWGADLFAWDFIGVLQSRKVADVAPRARLIHTVASESALRRLERNRAREILVQVNVAGEEGKAGVATSDLDEVIGRCPVPVTGLMTMPPATDRPEDSRPHFARLAELAAERGLRRLSMGTTQDFEVAVAEGATILRLGSVLYR